MCYTFELYQSVFVALLLLGRLASPGH